MSLPNTLFPSKIGFFFWIIRKRNVKILMFVTDRSKDFSRIHSYHLEFLSNSQWKTFAILILWDRKKEFRSFFGKGNSFILPKKRSSRCVCIWCCCVHMSLTVSFMTWLRERYWEWSIIFITRLLENPFLKGD